VSWLLISQYDASSTLHIKVKTPDLHASRFVFYKRSALTFSETNNNFIHPLIIKSTSVTAPPFLRNLSLKTDPAMVLYGFLPK
jgi:hypothetical protein